MSIVGFPSRLRTLADSLKIEHQALARAGGVSKVTFSNYLHGQKFPRMETLANWVTKYGVNANWLILGHGSMFLAEGEKESPAPVSAIHDPLIERMTTAVNFLKQANATDEVIQSAILATLGTKSSAT